ncbi:hypothetical protein TNCV_601531 [Trichonephila clavipes]|nr:hypothetical protein TNCV_601531 [Trichonephila clavipes]
MGRTNVELTIPYSQERGNSLDCNKIALSTRIPLSPEPTGPFQQMTVSSVGITILIASTNQESPQPVATQIARTAEADDCVIHCPAHLHYHNSDLSPIQSGGSISPQTSTSKDS